MGGGGAQQEAAISGHIERASSITPAGRCSCHLGFRTDSYGEISTGQKGGGEGGAKQAAYTSEHREKTGSVSRA